MSTKRAHSSSDDIQSPRKVVKTWNGDVRKKLDERHPQKTCKSRIPAFKGFDVFQNHSNLAPLPPLPQIKQAYLSNAAFTHSSCIESKYSSSNDLTYERLEFLGDAYIEIIATRLIYARFPQLLTGKQSALRESMVRNSTLATFARRYAFDQRIEFTGTQWGRGWEKVLGDVFEAYVAAVILSDPQDGFEVVEEWLTNLWAPMLLEHDSRSVPNRKDDLSRMIGGRNVKIEYIEDAQMQVLKDGSQQHSVSVYLSGWGYERLKLGSGKGIGKKEAGMVAAAYALEENSLLLEDIVEKKRSCEHVRKRATQTPAISK